MRFERCIIWRSDLVIKLEPFAGNRLIDFTWTGVQTYISRSFASMANARRIWKLQLTNPQEAIRQIEAKGKEEKGEDTLRQGLEEAISPESIEKFQETAADVASGAAERFKKNSKDAAQIFSENKEDAKEFVYDRLKIMSDALRSFNAGYQEGKAVGQEDALQKSPEELYSDIVQPLQKSFSEKMSEAVRRHDQEDEAAMAGSDRESRVGDGDGDRDGLRV